MVAVAPAGARSALGGLAIARAAAASFVIGMILATTPLAHAQDGEPKPPHPEPRVIVSVASVRGPHERAAVERAARLGWGRIVRCYREAKTRGTAPRGVVLARIQIAARGEVTSARRMRTTVERDLTGCLVGAMRGLDMPRARSGSSADVSIQVAPGD